MKYLIGVDLGTTNAKGVLYDEKGSMVTSFSSTYDTYHSIKGVAEQDSNDWWHAIKNIFSEIITTIDQSIKDQIKGICISSQTPTLLPVNKKGTPLRKAIIWMDGRAEKEMNDILEQVGHDRYVEITGMLPAVSFIPPKLLWYKNNEKQLFDNTYCFLQANGYINYKLTGNFTMDKDQASLTQCIDTSTGQWSEDIENAIGIKLKDYFPTPVNNDTIIGYVTEEASKETGLKVGIPVVAGSSDAIAAMYASGLTRLGEATEVSGTSSLVFAGTHELPKGYHTVGAHACSLKGIPYIYNAPITATGASIKWYLKNFGLYEEIIEKEKGSNVYDVLNQEAQLSNPGCSGVMFFPYMMGERAPLWNSHAKGMFIGLSMDTKREDMIRAIFEGTAYALKSVIDEFKRNGTKIDSLRVVGGGALSETWLKIKASILDLPVVVLDKKTGDVPFGDALIAGMAVGIYSDLTESIKEIIQVEKVIQPNPKWVKIYKQSYPFFKKFYSDLDENLKIYHKTISDN